MLQMLPNRATGAWLFTGGTVAIVLVVVAVLWLTGGGYEGAAID